MTCRATGGFGWSPPNSEQEGGQLMAWPAAATDPSADSGQRRDLPPWGLLRGLNLCGQWGGDTFYAGGDLDCAGAQIGRVQLTLRDGSQLQDDGVGNVSLFIGRRGAPPDYVEIFAPDGVLLSKRP
jgi:hypothetical protein